MTIALVGAPSPFITTWTLQRTYQLIGKANKYNAPTIVVKINNNGILIILVLGIAPSRMVALKSIHPDKAILNQYTHCHADMEDSCK
jgi:hypothetical protein